MRNKLSRKGYKHWCPPICKYYRWQQSNTDEVMVLFKVSILGKIKKTLPNIDNTDTSLSTSAGSQRSRLPQQRSPAKPGRSMRFFHRERRGEPHSGGLRCGCIDIESDLEIHNRLLVLVPAKAWSITRCADNATGTWVPTFACIATRVLECPACHALAPSYRNCRSIEEIISTSQVRSEKKYSTSPWQATSP